MHTIYRERAMIVILIGNQVEQANGSFTTYFFMIDMIIVLPFVIYNENIQWRHNELDGVSNHQRLDCLLNRFVQAPIKENMTVLRHWPLWGEFPTQRDSNAGNVVI